MGMKNSDILPKILLANFFAVDLTPDLKALKRRL
jgi:hypothetical protein